MRVINSGARMRVSPSIFSLFIDSSLTHLIIQALIPIRHAAEPEIRARVIHDFPLALSLTVIPALPFRQHFAAHAVRRDAVPATAFTVLFIADCQSPRPEHKVCVRARAIWLLRLLVRGGR